jgi:hypothetical protein
MCSLLHDAIIITLVITEINNIIFFIFSYFSEMILIANIKPCFEPQNSWG